MLLAKNTDFLEKVANRHGLVTGATGTGKTVTIKKLCELFSEIGVPTFVTDIKGDLSGFIKPIDIDEKLNSYLEKRGLDSPQPKVYPTTFWDLYAKNGVPLRATVSEMGPLVLSKLLGLNETQMGVLYSIFHIADEMGLLLLDYKDLDEMVKFVYENRQEFSKSYGNIASATIGAIQRQLLVLREQGLDYFLGEPSLDINDFLKVDQNGYGKINVLDSRKIHTSPNLYAAFILYLLSELLEKLPEVGDLDKPKLVFFFEEAHVLFEDAPKTLLNKIEQVVKLIRSKGVGIYFVTQNPRDIPQDILSQLSNKIQHALRVYSKVDEKALKTISDSMYNPDNLNLEEEIKNLKVGEAIVSLLDDNFRPQAVEKVFINSPNSRISPVEPEEIINHLNFENLYGKYRDTFDRESAFELLRSKAKVQEPVKQEQKQNDSGPQSFIEYMTKGKKSKMSPLDKMIQSTLNSIGRTVGRSITRGILGSFKIK